MRGSPGILGFCVAGVNDSGTSTNFEESGPKQLFDSAIRNADFIGAPSPSALPTISWNLFQELRSVARVFGAATMHSGREFPGESRPCCGSFPTARVITD